MKKFLKALYYVIAAIYPILVFTMLVIFKVDTKILSLSIIALAAAFFAFCSFLLTPSPVNLEKEI